MRRVPEQARSQAEPSCERKQIQKTKMLRVDGRSRISLLLHLVVRGSSNEGYVPHCGERATFSLAANVSVTTQQPHTLRHATRDLVLRLFLGRRSTA